MPNINEPEFDDIRDVPGFNARRAKLGARAGATRLGLSCWEVDPGQAAYPYHAHITEEEIVIALEGDLDLRTADGWRRLEPGEVVCFPTGRAGAHQIVNRGDSPARFLAISTTGAAELVLLLDAGKLGAFDRGEEGVAAWFREEDAVGYLEGVDPPDA